MLCGSFASYPELEGIRQVHCHSLLPFLESAPASVVVIDTETTGLDPASDEIIQVAMSDASGSMLLSSYVRPMRHESWPDAAMVNGIMPEDVAGAPVLQDLLPDIQRIIDGATYVAGYNVGFDLAFLMHGGMDVSSITACDVMDDYAALRGVGHRMGGWRWFGLFECCNHYGIENTARHRAEGDAVATAGCLSRVARDLTVLGRRGRLLW